NARALSAWARRPPRRIFPSPPVTAIRRPEQAKAGKEKRGGAMILCAGESLIDMVPQADAWRALPGGAVYNTAIALGRMAVDTGYLWPISRDGFGQALLRPLAAAGVDTGLCPRSDRLTTLAFVTLAGGEA